MFIPDPGSDFFPSRIPDPTFFHPGSRIRIKEFKYFNPSKWFLSSKKYDLGCSSRILFFLPIPDPGSRGQKGTGARIRIRNSVYNNTKYIEYHIKASIYRTIKYPTHKKLSVAHLSIFLTHNWTNFRILRYKSQSFGSGLKHSPKLQIFEKVIKKDKNFM